MLGASLDLQQDTGLPKTKDLSTQKGFHESLMKLTRCQNTGQPWENWEKSKYPVSIRSKKAGEGTEGWAMLSFTRMVHGPTSVLERCRVRQWASEASIPKPPGREALILGKQKYWLYWEGSWGTELDLKCRTAQFMIPHFPCPRVLHTILQQIFGPIQITDSE